MKICIEKVRLTWEFCRSVARVLLAYFKGLKRDDVADLDVPLGMLYMLEPVRINLQLIWTRSNGGVRSPMVLNSGPIVTTNQEIVSLKYTTINYGGQPLIFRIKVLGILLFERGVPAFQDTSYPQDLAFSIFMCDRFVLCNRPAA